MKNYLIIKHLQIQNANASSGAYIMGFPAMTAWLGAVHALQRKINHKPEYKDVQFIQVGVVAHKCTPHSRRINYYNNLIIPKKPLKEAAAKQPSFTPDPLINLNVSLIIETNKIDGDLFEHFEKTITNEVMRIKVASGTVLKIPRVSLETASTQQEEKRILQSLLPGYAIIERKDILLENPQAKDNLNLMLTRLASWEKGCRLAPIVTGFKQISDFVKVKNQRDYSLPHFFAESVVTLGEYRMPYRFENIDEMMWHYSINKEQGLYLCVNQ